MWAIWFLGVIISFGFLEAYAFKYPTRENTLSRTVSTLGKKWPLSIFLIGFLTGGLATHFFWPYLNPLGDSVGFLMRMIGVG